MQARLKAGAGVFGALGVFGVLSAFAGVCHADVYGYVDAAGVAHFAAEKLDANYRLFARGDRLTIHPGGDLPSAAAPAQSAGAALPEPGMNAYAELLERTAAEFDVDAALVKAVIAAESSFNPAAVSAKGAVGLMQVMPATAERYGVVGDKRRSVSQKLRDPATNVRVGTRYLADLFRLFPSQTRLVLASYNAGEGAVQQYNNRVPPYPETRAYVERVSRLYAAYRPPASRVIDSPQLRGRAQAAITGKRLSLTIVPPGASRAGKDESAL